MMLIPAAAQAPLLAEQRGVLTMAPVLERVTPAVVSVAVAAQADHLRKGRIEGVLVAEVPAGSMAWRVGLRRADIIFGLN